MGYILGSGIFRRFHRLIAQSEQTIFLEKNCSENRRVIKQHYNFLCDKRHCTVRIYLYAYLFRYDTRVAAASNQLESFSKIDIFFELRLAYFAHKPSFTSKTEFSSVYNLRLPKCFELVEFNQILLDASFLATFLRRLFFTME